MGALMPHERRAAPPRLPPAPPSLLTVAQAARLLRVHPNTLRSWADKGMVPVVMLPNGYRRFAPEEIEAVRRSMGLDRSDPPTD